MSLAIDILKKDGLNISASTAYKPELNGFVEPINGPLLSSVQSFLQNAKLQRKYLNYSVRHVNDCRNVLPISGKGNTPKEILFRGSSTIASHNRPFGCPVEF